MPREHVSGPALPPDLHHLSVVVPVHDEIDSLDALLVELDAALGGLELEIEWIFVDDASRDGSLERLRDWMAKDARLRVLSLAAHGGQSAALDAGFRAARGDVVAILDADGQNDPADIPVLLAGLSDADVVGGVRVDRHDSGLRRLSSRVANAVRRLVLRDDVSDMGCSLRVVRTRYLRRIKLYRGLHRFLPILLALEGARIAERPVSHRPRRFGRSKYGLCNRLGPALLDLLAVAWMQRRALHARATEHERTPG
jgi:glycosyltransferase involved in cell wall biosynthesis